MTAPTATSVVGTIIWAEVLMRMQWHFYCLCRGLLGVGAASVFTNNNLRCVLPVACRFVLSFWSV